MNKLKVSEILKLTIFYLINSARHFCLQRLSSHLFFPQSPVNSSRRYWKIFKFDDIEIFQID